MKKNFQKEKKTHQLVNIQIKSAEKKVKIVFDLKQPKVRSN